MAKQQYRVRDWVNYNQSLVQRGSLTLWMNDDVYTAWYSDATSQRSRGRPTVYSDILMETILSLKTIYRLPYRATIGFTQSILKLMNLTLELPHYATVSRRAKDLPVDLIPLSTQKPIHLAIDATGLKVYGEREWKVRIHGASKRRTWRKLHLSVNTQNHQIESAVFTTNDFKDSELLTTLIEDVDNQVNAVSADGAYDAHHIYQYLDDKNIVPFIPPRKNARLTRHANSKRPRNPRDDVIRQVKMLGFKKWKQQSGYHKRSLSETAMFRIKTIFGDKLSARLFDT